MPKQYSRSVRPIILLPDNPRIALVELTMDQFAVIDREDADRVGHHNWHAHRSGKMLSFYAQTNIKDENTGRWRTVGLHQFLMGEKDGLTVDHVSFVDTLDNRRCNLRHTTRRIQNCNQRLRATNKTGHRHVRKVGNRWRVQGKGIDGFLHLGYCYTLEEAVELAKSPLLIANMPQGTQIPCPHKSEPSESSGTNVSTEPSRSSSAADSISPIHTASWPE